MHKFTFHLLGLCHLPAHKKFLSCAFTQKNRKLAKMLTSLDHKVYFYGSEGSDIEEYCQSDNLIYIKTHTLKDIANDYGTGDNRFETGYDWKNQDFKHDLNSERKPSTLKFYKKCIDYINKVKKPDDFLLCTQGSYHKPIADAVKLFLICEPGIGYRGSKEGMYRSFESSYIQNFTYGSEHPFASVNGSYYDRVIPNYFDPDDITYSNKKKDYYLFIGRLIKRKGIITATMVCNALNKKLIIVGQGGIVTDKGHLIDNHPQEFDISPGTWEYQGFADIEKRKELMAHATAVFTPTEYLECFAGTHIESMLSGTPPITTNFGVFPETIPNYLEGKVGFRCNTLREFVEAAKKAKDTDPKFIREYAESFLMDNVKLKFEQWFQSLYEVYESATIPNTKGWSRL
jgi:glycosyltransferase involved in cell wall biosynthesis